MEREQPVCPKARIVRGRKENSLWLWPRIFWITVVLVDNKWFTRIAVAAALIETLNALDLQYPQVSKEKLKELAAAKQALIAGDPNSAA